MESWRQTANLHEEHYEGAGHLLHQTSANSLIDLPDYTGSENHNDSLVLNRETKRNTTK